jgi:hypothetical protein
MKDENAEDSSIKNISNFNETREKTA